MWDYERNGSLKPEMFSVSSSEPVFWKCPDCGHRWKSTIGSITRKGRYGCAECSKIRKGKSFTKRRVSERGSLAENNPELAKEWHPTKNGNMKPEDITVGRFDPVWWLCPICGYEWQASPNNRKKGVGCPHCAGRVPFPGIDDLETVSPELAKQWDYEKNEKKPSEYLPKSGKKVNWVCPDCGNRYSMTIRERSNGHGCPKCKGKKNSERCRKTQETFVKEIKEINPKIIVIGQYINQKTSIKVKCADCGYEWERNPQTLLHGSKCPKCRKNR